jgi:hypothetical protein
MTVVTKQSFRTGRAVVGFAPVLIGNLARVYDGTRYSCPPTNTGPIYLGPGPNDISFEIWPGQSLDLHLCDSAVWAVADDVDQVITWCQL